MRRKTQEEEKDGLELEILREKDRLKKLQADKAEEFRISVSKAKYVETGGFEMKPVEKVAVPPKAPAIHVQAAEVGNRLSDRLQTSLKSSFFCTYHSKLIIFSIPLINSD